MKRFLLCLAFLALAAPAQAIAGPVSFNISTIATSANPNDVAVGDVDGKSGPDIVATVGEELQVMLNNGNGTFGAPKGYPTGCPAMQVELADVTTTGTDLATDGKLDAVVLCSFGGGTSKFIGRMAGDGAGGFGSMHLTEVNLGAFSESLTEQNFALAYLRGPGLPPVPVFSYGTGSSGGFQSLFCTSYGWQTDECPSGLPEVGPPFVAGEIAQARVFALGGAKGIVDFGIVSGNTWDASTRELAPDLPTTVGRNYKSLTVGDLGSDGPDLISSSGTCGCGVADSPAAGQVDVLYGNLAEGVPDQVGTKFASAPGVGAIATGDFDVDGHTDLIGTSHSYSAATATTVDSVFVQTGNGSGGLEAPQMFTLGDKEEFGLGPPPVRVADLDGNGSSDAVAIVNRQIQVLLNTKAKVVPINALTGLKGLPKKVQVGKDGTILLGSASNPPTASVLLTITLPGGKAKGSAVAAAKPKKGKKKKGVVIGQAKIKVPAGKKRALKVHLKPKALAKLKQGKALKAKLSIVAVAVDGTKKTKTQALTIKPRGKAKKR